MVPEHWIDTLSRASSPETTRRRIARTLAFLLPGTSERDAGDAADKKKGGRGKGKLMGNGKGQHNSAQPAQPPPPSDAGDTSFDIPRDRGWRRFYCHPALRVRGPIGDTANAAVVGR